MWGVKDEVIPRKDALKMLVAADAVMMIFAVSAFLTKDFAYVLPILITSPFLLPMNIATICEELDHAHSAKYKEVAPLSAYTSIQDRAQKFLKLDLPRKMKKTKGSFVNTCIEDYAEFGQVNLNEKERTEISLEILETGISSQKPGKKTYYERERIAVLENILSEKQDQTIT